MENLGASLNSVLIKCLTVFLIYVQIYIVGMYQNRLKEAILMRTYNIFFQSDLNICFNDSLGISLVWSSRIIHDFSAR